MGVCQEGRFPAEGGNDGLVAGDGFPFARERRSGSRGWVSVCTGTTVGEPGMGSRCHGNDGRGSRGWVPVCTGTTVWLPRMGSRCHGNDGGGCLVSLRRTGEGGFQTRPYGSRDRGWVPAPYRVRGRLFGKLRTGSERRGGSYGGTVPARRNPAQGRNGGLLNCVTFNSRRSQNEMVLLGQRIAGDPFTFARFALSAKVAQLWGMENDLYDLASGGGQRADRLDLRIRSIVQASLDGVYRFTLLLFVVMLVKEMRRPSYRLALGLIALLLALPHVFLEVQPRYHLAMTPFIVAGSALLALDFLRRRDEWLSMASSKVRQWLGR